MLGSPHQPACREAEVLVGSLSSIAPGGLNPGAVESSQET